MAVSGIYTNFAGVNNKQKTSIMRVEELSREQLVELKECYMTMLADEGTFSEVVGRDYDEPSYEDLFNADSIIPDDVVLRNYEGIEFVKDDFLCTADR